MEFLFLIPETACARIVKTSLISILLKILEKWERYEGKMRLRICNYSLVTLQNVCCCSKYCNNIAEVTIIYILWFIN